MMKKWLMTLLLFSSSLYAAKLKVHWLGTASYLIQFGEVSLLTDPFYSQAGLLRTGLGTLHSDPKIVQQVVQSIQHHPVPSAIFIGHSHYDHMLDTAALLQRAGWHHTPVYGSQTTRHILAGYGAKIADHFVPTQADGKWHPVAKGLRYMAIPAEHADQLPGVFFYGGVVVQPRKTPPHKASDFKLGRTYAYLFEFTDGHEKATVYFTGAATRAPYGFPPASVHSVDVAILCVPSWYYTADYPDAFIRRLKPHVIIPSHYNDFFQTLKTLYDDRKILRVARLAQFVQRVKSLRHYPRFRRIILPNVGEEVSL